ncbi:MAG: FtsX-like permease family protein [Labilibaculum sp.]|nr:ABC transporter permease [Labilibaculum sp.]MBI9056177.1 FtsX-like permease family protein [Labilibaculum sp.]
MKLPISLKLSIRSILKNKVQSVISILGLGIGLGCVFLLLLLYIHENSFDKFIPQKENLYRIIRGEDCNTTYPLGSTIQAEIPQVNSFFRIHQVSQVELKNANNVLLKDDNFACADSSIYKNLGIKIRNGSVPRSVNEICISSSIADKYFAKEDPINQLLKIKIGEQFCDLSVCGVYKDFPAYSSLHPNFIGHIHLMDKFSSHKRKKWGHYTSSKNNFRDWNHFDLQTYVRLTSKAKPAMVEQSLQAYKNRTSDEKIMVLDYHLQPVSDIYLHSNNLNRNFYTRKGNPSELIYFLIISSLILIIAIVNYVFLTKAKIEIRIKDLGVQKAMGASSMHIFKQVLLESNLLAIISLIPASLIVILGIPYLKETLNRTLSIDVFTLWQSYIALILVVLITGSFAGLLIGFRVSKISSVLLIKGKLVKSIKRKQWGNSFLIVHFTIFVLLIVGVISIKKQLDFAQTGSKNIDTQNIIVCELNSEELSQQFQMIDSEIRKIPGVTKVAGSSFIPPFKNFLPVNMACGDDQVRFDGLIMGKGMIDLLGLKLIDGEGLGDFHDNRNEMVFNESAAKEHNLKVGSIFNGAFLVRGIVKDFNAHSFHEKIRPMVILQQDPKKLYLLAVKTTENSHVAVQKKLNQFFKKIAPDKIVKTYSLQDQINQFYHKEEQQVKIISAFSLLAIVLSIMGLLGMVLNAIFLKRKEIGIRKVNGAKTYEIVSMLNKDFLKWVVIAFTLACPIAWFVMNKWLENFAYKTELSWWIFALAGLFAMGIALLTVSFQSWRAATRNPVESLRYE